MKKWIHYLLLIFLVLLIGCVKESPLPTTTQALSIGFNISSQEKGFKATLSVDRELLEVNGVISFGLVYHHQEEVSLESFIIGEYFSTIELVNNNEEHYSFTFDDISKENYNLTYHFRAYIKYGSQDNPSVLYAKDSITTSLYLLAVTDVSTFSKEVVGYVEGDLIEEVMLTVDTKNYQVTTLKDGYQAVITTDYNYITIRVTLIEEKFFATDVILMVNEVAIEVNKWSISENILTYRFDDPNWTNPY